MSFLCVLIVYRTKKNGNFITVVFFSPLYLKNAKRSHLFFILLVITSCSRIITVSYDWDILVMETDFATHKSVSAHRSLESNRRKKSIVTQLILAPYPGKGWRVAATGKVDKLEHEDLWALNLDMGNWNNETWHDLKNYYADWGVCYLPRLNNLLQWQNQNITEIFSLTSTLYSSNSSCHQPSSHSFAILAMFFPLCKPRGLLFHFLQLYQNSRANTTLSPEHWFFLVISCSTDIILLDITNFFKIWSMVSWIWRISQEICAIRVGEIFWINSNKGVLPFLVRNSL